MNISEVYAREISREILISMLRDGVIPTGESLSYWLSQRVGDLNLNSPEVSQTRERIEYLEEASASKMQGMLDKLLGAIVVLYQAQLESEKSIIDSTSRAITELDYLARRAKDLDRRASSLLLGNKDTAGYLSVFGEDFRNLEYVSDESTCTVDSEVGIAFAGELTNEQQVYNSIDITRITDEDIQIRLSDPRASSSPGTRDSILKDMLSDSESPWLYTTRRSVPGDISISITIDLRNAIRTEVLKTRKISFDPYISNNSIKVVMQYSSDGITWEELPVIDPERVVVDPTMYIMEGIELTHLRIFIEKGSYDRVSSDGQYEYDFGIRKVQIEEDRSIFVAESELISGDIIFLEEDGSRKKFTQAALSKACDHVEPGSDVAYYISMLDSSLSRGAWQRVDPMNGPSAGPQRSASVEGATLVQSRVLINSTQTGGFSNTSRIYLLNGTVSNKDGVEVWRNVGKNTRYYKVRSPDGYVAEDGWNKKNGTYSCFFEISETGGTKINLGPRAAKINGRRVSGEVSLPEGIHFFETSEENWYSLEGLNRVTEFDSLTKTFRGTQTKYGDTGFDLSLSDAPLEDPLYSVIDPLYPYNHKLIIEGLEYNQNFEGDEAREVYKGSNIYGANILRRIANENNIDKNSFSVVESLDGTIEEKVAVHWTQEGSESPREEFLIKEKSNLSEAEGVVLKIVFKTSNPNITSSIEGYEIKIAE